MNSYDALILGGGRPGRLIAKTLAEAGKKTAIITFNDDSATLFERTVEGLWTGEVPPEADFHGPPGVDTYRGNPRLEGPRHVQVGGERLESKHIILAPGAIPRVPHVTGAEQVHFSQILDILNHPPASLAILGCGPLAASLAAWSATKKIPTRIVTGKAALLPKEEPEISSFVEQSLSKAGVKISLNSPIRQIRETEGRFEVVLENAESQEGLVVEKVVSGAGWQAHTKDFDLGKAGVFVNEAGRIVVNDQLKTSCPSIWAAGTAVQETISLSLEIQQAEALANNLLSPFFSQIRLDPYHVPLVFPTQPRVASVGEREAALDPRKIQSTCLTVPGEKDTPTIFKLVAEKKSGKILGLNGAGPLAEGVLLALHPAMRAEIPIFELWEPREYPSHGAGALADQLMRAWLEQ